jgi:hypothetical protein
MLHRIVIWLARNSHYVVSYHKMSISLAPEEAQKEDSIQQALMEFKPPLEDPQEAHNEHDFV